MDTDGSHDCFEAQRSISPLPEDGGFRSVPSCPVAKRKDRSSSSARVDGHNRRAKRARSLSVDSFRGDKSSNECALLALDGGSLDELLDAEEPAAYEAHHLATDVSEADKKIVESLKLLTNLEQQYAKEGLTAEFGYWHNSSMTAPWRKTLVEWMLQFPAEMSITQLAVGTAVDLMDRFFSKVGTSVSSRHLQLISLVCVFIGSKLHDKDPLTMGEVLQISKNTYSKKKIHEWEMKILETLEWRLMAPTAHEMACLMLQLVCPAEGETPASSAEGGAPPLAGSPVTPDAVAKSLQSFVDVGLDLANFEEYFLRFSAATIALSSVLVAFRAAGANRHFREFLKKIDLMGGAVDAYCTEVQQCQERMWSVLLKACPQLQKPAAFTPISPPSPACASPTPGRDTPTAASKRRVSPDSVQELYGMERSFSV